MKFYKVDLEYIRYLHSNDSRVQYNANYTDVLNQNCPYIGVVLKINEHNYFAPLEHPRPNHKLLKPNLHIYKIKGGRLGIIGLNNMIPVPEASLIDFDINADKNKKILVSQYIEGEKELIKFIRKELHLQINLKRKPSVIFLFLSKSVKNMKISYCKPNNQSYQIKYHLFLQMDLHKECKIFFY